MDAIACVASGAAPLPPPLRGFGIQTSAVRRRQWYGEFPSPLWGGCRRSRRVGVHCRGKLLRLLKNRDGIHGRGWRCHPHPRPSAGPSPQGGGKLPVPPTHCNAQPENPTTPGISSALPAIPFPRMLKNVMCEHRCLKGEGKGEALRLQGGTRTPVRDALGCTALTSPSPLRGGVRGGGVLSGRCIA